MKIGLENLAEIPLEQLIDRVSFNNRHSDWEIILRQCCTVQPDGKIFVDEMLFQSKRYGFDPNQAREDM